MTGFRIEVYINSLIYRKFTFIIAYMKLKSYLDASCSKLASVLYTVHFIVHNLKSQGCYKYKSIQKNIFQS